MANPKVEKLKDFGLRYGDKFAVALASVVFVLCLGMAFQRPTIDIAPEQIKKYAEQSESYLSRRQDPEEILKVLVEQGLQDSDFAKQAQDSAKVLLVADNYRAAREWVIPEPGAGLVRDTPKLIEPENLYAYPGRGAALVYALDSEGNRIPEEVKKEAPKTEPQTRRRKRASAMMGSGSMMAGMSGMMGGARKSGTGKSQAQLEKEAKADEDRRRREMQARLSGKDAPKEKDEEAKAKELADQGPPPKEITKGLRWVALTATLDHAQMLSNYRDALKNPSTAQPYYLRLEAQRQEQQSDGSWTEWEDVAAKRNQEILDNLPETDEELTPDQVRPPRLNDPLPFLKAGLWEKVHINSLVPEEKKYVAPAQLPSETGGMMGMMGSMSRGPGMMGSSMMMGEADMMSRMGSMGRGMMGSSMMGPGMMGGMMDGEGGYMGAMGMGGGGVEGITNFWKSEEKKLMVRALDFTAEPDANYRYRTRIVVHNPNYKREDLSPTAALTKETKELFGPWSEPSNEVHMPPDVSAYAMGVLPGGAKSDMKVSFQVVKFSPDDGVTVPASFDASPGEVIGEALRRDIPVSDGTGKKAKLIDFNSHQIVLDVDGGWQPMPSGVTGGGLARPALALLLRPDGSVVVRDEADDRIDVVRKDIESNYKRELEESNKARESSMGSGYGSMMESMMGGMMGGGRRGR
jgi:hypothetical protein